MEAGTLKRIRIGCLAFAILWFVAVGFFEARYLIKLSRVQPQLRAVLRIAYEEQIEGINFVVMLMYLTPGIFSWFVYRRFRKY
jgi:hypothetical protein